MNVQRILVLLGLFAMNFCRPASGPALELHQIFEESWNYQLQEFPVFATMAGVQDRNHQLASVSEADQQRRADYWRQIKQRLQGIEPGALEADDRVNYDIFLRQLEDDLSAHQFKSYLIPITAETGFHTGFARLPSIVPLENRRDYHNYLSRLALAPTYFQQHIELMRKGIEQGLVLPRIVLEGYHSTIEPHITDDLDRSVFFGPFKNFPAGFSPADREQLLKRAADIIKSRVVPAYRSFLEFMTNEYLPNCRSTLGASELPNGREYYAYLVRHHTTLDLTPEEIHQTGLQEVARIRAEMDHVIEQVGFQGSFEQFLQFLRTDPRFYAQSGEELLKEASWIAKKMDGKLPSLFKTLPRLPYGVEPVPDHLAPKYTAGRYVGAPRGSTRPGYYWVNTFALQSRPLYALPALTLHEAVPGHHLQNALQMELENLPDFRRFSSFNAYGEGWGLYSEWLGLEAGFYQDPYRNFGRLTYEMWRACRLVVDTGLHAQGWTRQQAIDFLTANTALSLHEIGTETDRYISWPGQALAYKIGELKIRELRRRAEETLGEAFDLREFHDVILLSGPVPLTVLEAQVERYLEKASSTG